MFAQPGPGPAPQGPQGPGPAPGPGPMVSPGVPMPVESPQQLPREGRRSEVNYRLMADLGNGFKDVKGTDPKSSRWLIHVDTYLHVVTGIRSYMCCNVAAAL